MPTCANRTFSDVVKGVRAGGTLVGETPSGQGSRPVECRGALSEEFQEVRPKRKYTKKACVPQDAGVKAAKRKYTCKVKDPVANVGDDRNVQYDVSNEVAVETAHSVPSERVGEESEGLPTAHQQLSVAGRCRGRGAPRRTCGRGRGGRGMGCMRMQGDMQAPPSPEPMAVDAS